jgi:hypothetical protein
VKADLKNLEDSTDKIRRLVNKRIAHFTNHEKPLEFPTYKDLDNAMDVIQEILCRYNLLLNAMDISPLLEERPNTWMKVLQAPWLIKGMEFYK